MTRLHLVASLLACGLLAVRGWSGICPPNVESLMPQQSSQDQFCCWDHDQSRCLEPGGKALKDTAQQQLLAAKKDSMDECVSSCLKHDTQDIMQFDVQCPSEASNNQNRQPQHRQRIAFIIMVHNDLPHFKRMFRRLYNNEQGVYWIHVDSTATEMVGKITQFMEEEYLGALNEGVIAIASRFEVYWGQNSIVRATVMGITNLLKMSQEWGYVVNLSGSHYPLRSVEHMLQHFNNNAKGRSYIAGSKHLTTAWDGSYNQAERVQNVSLSVKDEGVYHNIRREFFPEQISFRLGAQWWALDRDFADYVATDRQMLTLLKYGDTAHVYDEIFFQTALANSPFCHEQVDMWAVDEDNPDQPCTFAKWGDDPRHPVSLGMGDIENLKTTGCWFARKITSEDGSELCDQIDQQILHQA